MVIISDVGTDSDSLGRLQLIMAAFESQGVPNNEGAPLFLLIGNFSGSENTFDIDPLAPFSKLAATLTQFPALTQRCHFVLVPGPTDPGPSGLPHSILPRPPLSSYLTRTLQDRIPNLILASNPCRLSYHPLILLAVDQ